MESHVPLSDLAFSILPSWPLRQLFRNILERARHLSHRSLYEALSWIETFISWLGWATRGYESRSRVDPADVPTKRPGRKLSAFEKDDLVRGTEKKPEPETSPPSSHVTPTSTPPLATTYPNSQSNPTSNRVETNRPRDLGFAAENDSPRGSGSRDEEPIPDKTQRRRRNPGDATWILSSTRDYRSEWRSPQTRCQMTRRLSHRRHGHFAAGVLTQRTIDLLAATGVSRSRDDADKTQQSHPANPRRTTKQ